MPLLRAALFALLCGAWLLETAQTPPDGTWLASNAPHRTCELTYSSPATLLGKQTKLEILFFCSPTSTKTERSMLGIEPTVQGVAALKPFQFHASEGPDATTHGIKLMRLAVKRPGKPNRVVDLSPNAWTPDNDRFTLALRRIAAEREAPKSLVAGAG